MKIRKGIGCGGSSLKLSLTNDDDQDRCYTKTKGKFNAGTLLEWSSEDLGNCSSANMILKSPKVAIIPSDSATNICPEHLTVRINDNLFAASYEEGLQTFQVEQQQKSLTGNRSYIESHEIKHIESKPKQKNFSNV